MAIIVLYGCYRSSWLKLTAFERPQRGNSWPEALTVNLFLSLMDNSYVKKQVWVWKKYYQKIF